MSFFDDFQFEWKLFGIVLLVSLVIAAGLIAFNPSTPPSVVQPREVQGDTSPLPVISLRYQGKTYEGVQGSYCWPTGEGGEGVTLCADTIFPLSNETIVVEKGDELEVLVKAAATPQSLGVSVFNAEQTFITSSELKADLVSSFSADQDPGIYHLLVFGTWSEGDIGYGFKIEVQDSVGFTLSEVEGVYPELVEGWQTYLNEEFGFEFRYPADWFITDISATSASPFHLAIDSSPINPSVLDGSVATIQISLNRCWKQLEKYPCQDTVLEAAEYRESFIDKETLKEKVISISGRDAMQISGVSTHDLPLGNIYSNVVIIPWDDDDQLIVQLARSDLEDIFDQILSTFRFVDSEMSNSGITGTTSYFVVSGVPGGGETGGPTSLEFAIAPIEGKDPAYDKATFVISDKEGKYEVVLAPGKYWIGPKAKALDPDSYAPGSSVFSETVVVVEEGAFIQTDLSHTGLLP